MFSARILTFKRTIGFIDFIIIDNNKKHKLSFYPSLSTPISFLDKYHLELHYSFLQYSPTEMINIDNKECKCSLVLKSFEEIYNNIYIGEFFFCYSQDVYSSSRLALSFQVNEMSSIIYQSYKMGFIDKKNFCFHFINNTNKLLYIGGMPKEYEKLNKGSCSVIEGHMTWGCLLTSIIIFEEEFVVGKYAVFDNEIGYMSFPLEFFDYFNKVANERNRIKERKKQLDIKLRFDNYALRTKNQIILSSEGKYFLKAVKSNGDIYIFGQVFLEKYMVLFDYEEKSISFYSEEGIEDLNGNWKLRYILILEFNLIMLTVSIILLLGIIKVIKQK